MLDGHGDHCECGMMMMGSRASGLAGTERGLNVSFTDQNIQLNHSITQATKDVVDQPDS